MRRNLPMIYIIEDNGVLRPDQGTVLGDRRSRLEAEDRRRQRPAADRHLRAGDRTRRDVCCGRSFSGDKKQLLSLLKAAIAHRGTVMLDVISPCVTFNDHEGSTKSYKFMKDHDEPVEDMNFVPHFEDIEVEYEPGTTQKVTMHDGSKLHLKKLEKDYDPCNKTESIRRIMESHKAEEVLTGILYLDTKAPNFVDMINMTDEPLANLPESVTRPSREALEACMEELR